MFLENILKYQSRILKNTRIIHFEECPFIGDTIMLVHWESHLAWSWFLWYFFFLLLFFSKFQWLFFKNFFRWPLRKQLRIITLFQASLYWSPTSAKHLGTKSVYPWNVLVFTCLFLSHQQPSTCFPSWEGQDFSLAILICFMQPCQNFCWRSACDWKAAKTHYWLLDKLWVSAAPTQNCWQLASVLKQCDSLLPSNIKVCWVFLEFSQIRCITGSFL